MTAWSNLQPGDQLNVRGVTFTGELNLGGKQLSSWAEIHFDSATSFTGVSSGNYPAVWLHGDKNIRFYGGNVSNRNGGGGILVYDSAYLAWWGFVVHDVGGSGLTVQGISTANTNLDLKGEIYHWGLNLSLDPHAEKGTGLHGALLADAYYGVKNSRFALYLHDGATGAGVQAGGSSSTDGFWNNSLYLWCQNLTMVATTQVGGNCEQVWGDNVLGNTTAYLLAENLQGRAYDANGMYSGQSLSTNTIAYGRASKTNLNPYLARTESAIASNVAWDYRYNTVRQDVSPTP
jgi:hypothetical protein